MDITQEQFEKSFERKRVIYYPEDCEYIRSVAKDMGLDMSVNQACVVWEWHSDNYCAGWLMMDVDHDGSKGHGAYKDVRSAIERFVSQGDD